jgi:hypothetical protein
LLKVALNTKNQSINKTWKIYLLSRTHTLPYTRRQLFSSQTLRLDIKHSSITWIRS